MEVQESLASRTAFTRACRAWRMSTKYSRRYFSHNTYTIFGITINHYPALIQLDEYKCLMTVVIERPDDAANDGHIASDNYASSVIEEMHLNCTGFHYENYSDCITAVIQDSRDE